MATYSPEQISRYFEHIKLPYHHRIRLTSSAPPTYTELHALHIHQITTFPYENLSLHYNPTNDCTPPNPDIHPHNPISRPIPSLDPQVLYDKLIRQNRGRGGYCFELATFYYHVLRTLDFRVYRAGVRIRVRRDGVPSGEFIGRVHVVNIVTLDSGHKYMIDVAFGGDGPIRPLLLQHAAIVPNLHTQQMRLVSEYLPEQSDKTSPMRVWVYQIRNSEEKDWVAFYSFYEVETLLPDLEMAAFWVCRCEESHQLGSVLVIKFLRRKEDGDVTVSGKVMLAGDTVKENMDGKTRAVYICKSEEDRLRALREYFGLYLDEAEQRGILKSSLALT